MTDQLPRQIPQDPAEQERLMPEWVKVEVCRLWFWKGSLSLTRHDSGVFAHALTIWQWCPEPGLQRAREVCAESSLSSPEQAKGYLEGRYDDCFSMQVALAAIKRGRAMERGEG